MFDKDLKLDGKRLKKTKNIKARRPSEYWLLFFKKYIFIKRSPPFRLRYLLFAVPIIILLVVSIFFGSDDVDYFAPFIIASAIVSIIVNVFLAPFLDRNDFIDNRSFNYLAKFIIDIKGDVYRNNINLHLNLNTIECRKYKISPSKIGLRKKSGIRYSTYQLERYNAGLILKDGSLCNVALNQISIKVFTTKRSSSGKLKTKHKHKHKLFYTLSLKLKKDNYKLLDESKLGMLQQVYNISTQMENNLYIIKIKHKEKLSKISSSISENNQRETSIYTNMLNYLIDKQIIISKTSNTLLSQ